MTRSVSYVSNIGADFHGIVDEGGYFTTNNAQTAVATAAAPTSFSATNPFIAIFNKQTAGATGPNIYLDFIAIIATAAGTAGTSVQFAVTLDFNGDRYSSGGTDITANIVNPSGASNALNASNAKVRIGNITAGAATTSVRTVVGNRWLKTAIPAAGDTYMIKFGAVDGTTVSGPTAAVAFTTVNVPKIIIPPQGSMLVHLWLPSQSAASNYLVEASWYER